MRYRPAPSVAVVRTFSISAGLAASTVTPGRTAPDESLTAPAIVACAHAVDCAATRHASTKHVRTHTRICIFSDRFDSRSPGHPDYPKPGLEGPYYRRRADIYETKRQRLSRDSPEESSGTFGLRKRFHLRSCVFRQANRRQLRTTGQRPEFRPGNLGVHRPETGECPHPAIRAGHHPLASADVGEARDPLGDELGMFDIVGAGIDDTRDEHLVIRKFLACPYFPFVLVARVGSLDEQHGRPGLE